MSRKRATPRTTHAAQRRAEAAAAATRRAPAAAPRSRTRAPVILGGVVVVVVVVLIGAAVALGSRSSRGPSASPAAIASAATGTSTPSAGPPASALVGGGPLAEKVVAALHATPFRAHIDETTVARSTGSGVTITLTASAKGDVSGRDVALQVTSTGGGPAVDQEVVSLGSTTWIRRTGATAWEVHPRSEASSSIDGLLATIQLLDDPTHLADAGPDTVDGQAVRHLTAVGGLAYRSPDGIDGSYDHLDVWATDAGVPVLVRGSFSAQSGTNAIIGNLSIRYSDVGKPVTITPPSGAPTAIP